MKIINFTTSALLLALLSICIIIPACKKENTTLTSGVPAGIIGYLGGSLTYNATDGYRTVGGTRLWVGNDRSYGGGTVTVWASGIGAGNSNKYWGAFDSLYVGNVSRGATTVVWFELLSHGNEDYTTVYNAAISVLAEIRKRIPGVIIYVSGMNGYVQPQICSGVTPEAPAQMRQITAQLVAEGRALAGPLMPELTTTQATSGAGCHANNVGKPILGNVLTGFFGK